MQAGVFALRVGTICYLNVSGQTRETGMWHHCESETRFPGKILGVPNTVSSDFRGSILYFCTLFAWMHGHCTEAYHLGTGTPAFVLCFGVKRQPQAVHFRSTGFTQPLYFVSSEAFVC